MPLQIRVTHSLGGQIIDVPELPSDRPFFVGRAAGVELQVPSASVAPRQLAFFVHDGYWFVQDHSGAGTTFVNSQPIDQATALQMGDVVHAGAGNGAATIEIAPSAAAAGYTGYLTSTMGQQAAAPVANRVASAPPRPTSAPRVPPRHMRQAGEAPMPAGYVPTSEYGQATGYAQAGYAAAPAEQAPADDLSALAQPTGSYTPRRTRRKKDNTGMIVLMVIAAVVIVGGTVLAITLINKSRETPPPPPAPEPKKEVAPQAPKKKTLFGM